MNMSGEIRVRADRKYKSLYNELKNFVLGDMHELFFVCVVLGYREGKKSSLGSTGEDRFWSKTITPEEYACYYAIVMKEHGMDLASIQDDKAVIAAIEEYANAGMEILIEEFLSDYLMKGKEEPRIDTTCSKELSNALLHYIYEKIH